MVGQHRGAMRRFTAAAALCKMMSALSTNDDKCRKSHRGSRSMSDCSMGRCCFMIYGRLSPVVRHVSVWASLVCKHRWTMQRFTVSAALCMMIVRLVDAWWQMSEFSSWLATHEWLFHGTMLFYDIRTTPLPLSVTWVYEQVWYVSIDEQCNSSWSQGPRVRRLSA